MDVFIFAGHFSGSPIGNLQHETDGELNVMYCARNITANFYTGCSKSRSNEVEKPKTFARTMNYRFAAQSNKPERTTTQLYTQAYKSTIINI